MSDSASLPTAPIEARAADPFVGVVVGERYRLIDRIGEGGMGSVYKAEHILMKKVVALKLLHAEYGQVEEMCRRFEREAQSASRLSHPNIIAVTDFGRGARGDLFLVMEFVPGVSLASVLEREAPLPLARALRIVRQILLGLEHAHAQGVVHRDLKPANIMITPSMESGGAEGVKILDFGIAKMSQVAEGERPLTQGAMVFGTPSYMSPEQATAQDVDARADLYACGVILYELAVGRKPFVAEDLVKVMAMQVTTPPPPFGQAAPDLALPAALETVVMRALEKDRARRYPSAAVMRAALEGVRAGTSTSFIARIPTLVSGLRARAARALARVPWPVRRWLPAGAAALALLAVTGVLLVGTSREGPAPTAKPPPPKPVEPELKLPLAQIQQTVAKGRITEARVMIMQQLSLHPKVGRLRLLLGHIELAEKNAAAGLDAFREALRLDPGLRADASLLVAVRGLVGDRDRDVARAALDLMTGQIGKPACGALAQIASRDRRPDFRAPARATADELGCGGEVDKVASYGMDLEQARGCEDKRAAVQKLGETADARAVEPLRKARRDGGFLFFGGGNACVRKDIDAALRALGVDPVESRRGRRGD